MEGEEVKTAAAAFSRLKFKVTGSKSRHMCHSLASQKCVNICSFPFLAYKKGGRLGEEQNEVRWNKFYFVPAPKEKGGEKYRRKWRHLISGFNIFKKNSFLKFWLRRNQRIWRGLRKIYDIWSSRVYQY